MSENDINAYSVWEKLAPYYDEVNGINDRNMVEATTLKHGDRMLKILEYFGYDQKKGLVVDLGCGTGNLCCYLGFLGYRVVGVDISAEMIKISQRKQAMYGLGNVTFVQKDALALDNNDIGGPIGFLYSKEGFSHFPDLRYMFGMFSHLFSLMPPSTVFIFEVFTEMGIGVLVTKVRRQYPNFIYEQGGLYDHDKKNGYIDYRITLSDTDNQVITTQLPIYFWDTEVFNDLLTRAGFRKIEFFDDTIDVVYSSGASTIALRPPSFLSETFLVKAEKL